MDSKDIILIVLGAVMLLVALFSKRKQKEDLKKIGCMAIVTIVAIIAMMVISHLL